MPREYASPKNIAVVLAAHGVPASDCPPRDVGTLMMLEHSGRMAERVGFLRAWRDALEQKLRVWPRTPQNDPYKAAVDELAAGLQARLGWRVLPGYNEFCAPRVKEAIDQAVAEGAARVIVVPTMLVRDNNLNNSFSLN
ncbi:MAG: hypothetical protein HY327_14005 [Chloroflexi bacterium]|nr:hypothetical protein [Chloroflexota bacterium]